MIICNEHKNNNTFPQKYAGSHFMCTFQPDKDLLASTSSVENWAWYHKVLAR